MENEKAILNPAEYLYYGIIKNLQFFNYICLVFINGIINKNFKYSSLEF